MAIQTSRSPVGRVAINMRPTSSPWGGGNQWVRQIARYLTQRGYAVSFDLNSRVDSIILVDPRVGGLVEFGPEEIRSYKRRFPEACCIHRINENDQRKNTGVIDTLLAQANEVADHTVFISEWLRNYHAERWFDNNKPHAVIINGADPRIFHPIGGAEFVPDGIMRIVTHHWSDNWMKGFAVYQEIDRLISDRQLPSTELWVIGRWPTEIRWRAAQTFGPRRGARLGRMLRNCHVYVTASLWEPGGMHFVEGVQCGLPLLYHMDGGGIVELGRRFGVGFRNDIRLAILEMRERYPELRRAVLQNPPSGDRMCVDYGRVIQQTIQLKRSGG